MEIHPLFDINDQCWVAELDGNEIVAETLRELQTILPDATIVGYNPNGCVVTRDSSSVTRSTHIPFVTCRPPAANIGKATRHKRCPPTPVGEAGPEITKAEPKPKTQYERKYTGRTKPGIETHNKIMDLVAEGLRSPTIAKKLGLTLATAQIHRMAAYKEKDPRAIPKPVRMMTARKGPPHNWTDADDALMVKMAAEWHNTYEIAEAIGCTRNAVIGRARRKGVKLLCKGGPRLPREQRAERDCGVEQRTARQSHKLKVGGSNPSPATKVNPDAPDEERSQQA